MINAPVLHVNGDHPEGNSAISPIDAFRSSYSIIDVVKAMDIAFKYRHYFRKDIIVDLLVYRRWQVCFCLPKSIADHIIGGK